MALRTERDSKPGEEPCDKGVHLAASSNRAQVRTAAALAARTVAWLRDEEVDASGAG
jgi:hypothetical protein